MRRAKYFTERVSFNLTSKDALRPPPRDKGHSGEVSMSSTQVNIMHSEPHVTVSISLPSDLLKSIEQNIVGLSTNEKILKCVRIGYELLRKGK